MREDSFIDFTGYGNKDCIQTPVHPPIDAVNLALELVEGTSKYFMLCTDGVAQMDSYIDIEAVSRLLEEKERDLELAAQIGQSLLEKNKRLEENNDQLEELISQDNERINQLRHDLTMKDELLQHFLQNYDNTDVSSTDSTDGLSTSALQKRISTLEEENLHLLLEIGNLKSVTDEWDNKEQKLIQQLDDLRQQLAQCSKELAEKTEKCSLQEDEIADLQKHIHAITAENVEYHKALEETRDSRDYLTREIADLKEKNEEIFLLLEETEDELRHFRNNERRTRALSHSSYMSSFHNVQGDSLATELETSLRSDIDYPKGYSPNERKKHTQNIFETARAARAAYKRHASFCGASLLGTSGFESEDLQSVSQRNSMCLSDAESVVSDGYGGDIESLYGGSSNRLGKPGIPRSSDFQTESSHLTQRRVNESNELDYGEEGKARQEMESRKCTRTVSDVTEFSDTESLTSKQCPSPDSTFSGNSGYVSMAGSLGNHYRMPDRLKIVKPLEGSLSLLRWQKLATPTIGVILESSPGVHSRGEPFDFVTGVYNLSDYEEDDDTTSLPAQYSDSTTVYTLTDSSVTHPFMSTSLPTPSFTTSMPHMTFGDRFRHGTITYSMSLGLASLLNELNVIQTPIQSMYDFNPTQFPDLASETHYNASKSDTSSVSLPVPNDGYQLTPLSLTLSQMQGSLNRTGSQNPPQSDQQYAARDSSDATTESVDSNTIYVINKLTERGSSLFNYLRSGVGIYKAGFTGQLSGQSPLTPISASVTNVTETTTQSHASRQSYFTSFIIKKSCW